MNIANEGNLLKMLLGLNIPITNCALFFKYGLLTFHCDD